MQNPIIGNSQNKFGQMPSFLESPENHLLGSLQNFSKTADQYPQNFKTTLSSISSVQPQNNPQPLT